MTADVTTWGWYMDGRSDVAVVGCNTRDAAVDEALSLHRGHRIDRLLVGEVVNGIVEGQRLTNADVRAHLARMRAR